MESYSENQIQILHTEFRSYKKYADKLAFFDRIFGIIPFHFPAFDARLGFLFESDKMGLLADIYKRERNNPSLTEKKFFFEETYTFNVKPANSNNSAYSGFILNRFLDRQPFFEDWYLQKSSADTPPEYFLDEANRTINHIEYLLQNEYDKSFRLQCMSVFYKGLYEAFTGTINLPDKKRKFIELFLYAQGIIYSNYLRFLKSASTKTNRLSVSKNKPALDLSGKLALLHELGIVDFLRNRYPGMDDISFENKMTEIFCLITEQYASQKEIVRSIFSDMIRQPHHTTIHTNSVSVKQNLPFSAHKN